MADKSRKSRKEEREEKKEIRKELKRKQETVLQNLAQLMEDVNRTVDIDADEIDEIGEPLLEKTSATWSFTGFSLQNPRQLITSLPLYLRICFPPCLAFPPSPKTPQGNFLSIFNFQLKYQVFCENFLQRHHSSGKKVGFEFS